MNLTISFVRQFYQLKLKINRLTERDRILLLFISTVVLLVFWYFGILNFQLQDLNHKNQEIQDIQAESAKFIQKKIAIENIVNNPDAALLLARYKDLTKETTKLDEVVNNYNKRYISSRDLAKLMHDMLQKTYEVVIDDFSTVVSPPVSITQPISGSLPQSTAQPTPKITLSLEPIHYRLIMRGSYFSIMNYLKKLEELPWHLYWDKFDYTVSKYPEGLAIMEFYTLKPVDIHQPVIQQGGNT